VTIAPPNSKLLLIFIAGSAAIAGQIVIGALMMALAPSPEWVVAGVVVSFLLGVPLGILLTRALPALAFPAMGVFALTGLVPAFVIDVPLWGSVVDLRQVNAVPIATGIAGYVAPGWHIDTSRASQERLTASRGSRGYGFRRIAPLVGKGWTPEHPVGIWVSGETRDSGRVLPWHPQFWSEPGGEFVRLVGKNVSGAQLAAKRAAEKFGLLTDEEPVVVMRVPSVAAALTDQHWALVRAARFPFAAWALLIGLAAAICQWRNRRSSVGTLGRP
jgi:hypothetical protein